MFWLCKGATSEMEKYIFRAANVLWRCAQYFVIASCGKMHRDISATVIVRAGGAIWLKQFATVLFSVCGAVTVEYCALYPCCMGMFGMFAVM